jgi:drug/metabolite transporter (DMT)-like permease
MSADADPLTMRRNHRNAVLLLCFCALLWSTAGVFTRQLERAESFEVTFWRSLFCVLGVGVVLALRNRGNPLRPMIAMGAPGLISGLMWAIMFTCFMVALTRTTVANVLLVSSLSPLLAALLAWLVLRERIRVKTWLAIGVAAFGIWWMVRDGVSAQGIAGMLIALGVPIAAAVNLVTLRKMRARIDLAPAVLLGGLLSCAATLPGAWPLSATYNDLAILAFLGLFQLALPCVLMVRVARYLAPQEIALIALLEIVLGSLLAWAGAGEALSTATLQGGAIVLFALIANELVPDWQASSTIKTP